MRKLQVLIACEESQTICREFRRLGHIAYSCDLQECSGGHPEWHFLGDCFDAIHFCGGRLQTGDYCFILGHWDLVIAHPPCTYLARCQFRLMNEEKYGDYARERKAGRDEAAAFFMRFINETTDIPYLAVENPVGHMTAAYRTPDQTIQPWMWGDKVSKATCLWTRSLPQLVPAITDKPIDIDTSFFTSTRRLPDADRRRARSKTFPGIARAIAEQWSEYIINNL